MNEKEERPRALKEATQGLTNEIAESFTAKLILSVYESEKEEVAKQFPEIFQEVENGYNGLILDFLNAQGVGLIHTFDSFDHLHAYQLLKIQIEGKDRGYFLSSWYRDEKECIFEGIKHSIEWVQREANSSENLERAEQLGRELQDRLVRNQQQRKIT